MSKAHILFENGIIIDAEANLNDKTVLGELVFNTSMTGYQEVLTDPSYVSQIVVMTYPLIGNYGILPEFSQSNKIQPEAFIIRENSEEHIENVKSLSDFLAENQTLCLTDVDTRKLTKIIRSNGAVKCLLTTEDVCEKHKKMLADFEFPKDVVQKVSSEKIEKISADGEKKADFALIDYGVKTSIIKALQKVGAEVTVYPYNVDSEIVLNSGHDAVFLSNGPGNPKDVDIRNVKNILGKLPIFGICLGNQIAALALGADTYKLKFGHRGSNHPVLNLETNKVYITSQNHGYAIDEKSLPDFAKVTYKNINDNTVEGFVCEKFMVECTQFHPEACAGVLDTAELFSRWVKSAERGAVNA